MIAIQNGDNVFRHLFFEMTRYECATYIRYVDKIAINVRVCNRGYSVMKGGDAARYR